MKSFSKTYIIMQNTGFFVIPKIPFLWYFFSYNLHQAGYPELAQVRNHPIVDNFQKLFDIYY
jgi:hypothetical protein